LKTLIGWALAILIPVMLSSLTSKNDRDEAINQDFKLGAVHEERLNVIDKNQTILFNKINDIEKNTSETHDNMIILMVHSGLEDVMIENTKKK
jgi:hypothetical protein